MPSDALASADIAALATPRGRACLMPGEAAALETVSGLVVGLPAGNRAIGVRVARGSTLPLRVYSDQLDFAVGPTELALEAVSSQGPPPQALERHLLAVLYRRAQTLAP